MGHFVGVYSVDEARLRAVLGSSERELSARWIERVRQEAGRLGDGAVVAAERLAAGDFHTGECDDGSLYGHVFALLCDMTADRRVKIEAYVSEAFPELWDFVTRSVPNPYGLPTSPYGWPYFGSWAAGDVMRHRKAFRAAISLPGRERHGGTEMNMEGIDAVLSHAQDAGRGVLVYWSE